jgi:hypothetical protein
MGRQRLEIILGPKEVRNVSGVIDLLQFGSSALVVFPYVTLIKPTK